MLPNYKYLPSLDPSFLWFAVSLPRFAISVLIYQYQPLFAAVIDAEWRFVRLVSPDLVLVLKYYHRGRVLDQQYIERSRHLLNFETFRLSVMILSRSST